jgi:tRNA-Thr(GGU) m(6)t(6)A37 methyltransferase TsaA
MAEKPADIEMTLQPVGVVRSAIKTPLLGADSTDLELKERLHKIREQHRQLKELVSELVIDPHLEGILDGIEAFSHIVVLYWPHLVAPERRGLRQVHPMGRKDLPLQGVFATRSPARPNPVLVSTVRLLAREGNVLRVQALEAVDGSPIVDIKPYVDVYHTVKNPRFPEWLLQIQRDLADDAADSDNAAIKEGVASK